MVKKGKSSKSSKAPRKSSNNDEQEGDVVESPGCDGVGVMCRDGDGVGVMEGIVIIFLSLVMAWGYGVCVGGRGGYGRDSDYIPFLADGVGSWGL